MLLLQFASQLVKVDRRHALAGSTIDRGLAAQDLRPKRFGESVGRLANFSLHKLHDAARKGQVLGAVHQRLSVQLVLHHELGQVADNFGRRCDLEVYNLQTGQKTNNFIQYTTNLDNISQRLIGLLVGALDVGKFLAQAQRKGLELQVGVLAAGDFVLVNVRTAAFHRRCALKRAVQQARDFPVEVVLAHVFRVDSWVHCRAGQPAPDKIN